MELAVRAAPHGCMDAEASRIAWPCTWPSAAVCLLAWTLAAFSDPLLMLVLRLVLVLVLVLMLVVRAWLTRARPGWVHAAPSWPM